MCIFQNKNTTRRDCTT